MLLLARNNLREGACPLRLFIIIALDDAHKSVSQFFQADDIVALGQKVQLFSVELMRGRGFENKPIQLLLNFHLKLNKAE